MIDDLFATISPLKKYCVHFIYVAPREGHCSRVEIEARDATAAEELARAWIPKKYPLSKGAVGRLSFPLIEEVP
jgi:hypothetical protein